MSRIHVKKNSKRIWTYAHIPMYADIGVKPAYVCGYRGKIRVYHLLYSFLGMINDTSKDKMWSMGSKESAAGQGKAIQSVIHMQSQDN